MKRIERGKRRILRLLALAILLIHVEAGKQKRQIFREQVLPALGGKIPEEAFRTDRLALNRLNKEGISIPDGVVLDARHVHKHPHPVQGAPEVIKVYLTPDGRYVPPEGRVHYNHPNAVDTTYVIRKPFGRDGRGKSSNNYGSYKQRPKQQPYTNYRQFVPLVPPSKPGIYRPIVAPLVVPASHDDFLAQPYLPTWDLAYDWGTVYQPLNEYFVDNIALYNSHQIIADYQGFIDQFHERSSRHVNDRHHQLRTLADDRRHDAGQPTRNSQAWMNDKNRGTNVPNFHSEGYTNLTKIPETGFSCRGRKGMFADVETKCQVFHSCSGWSRTSSLCPSGTAFSEEKKRCEWWNIVHCRE